jgi:ABC-2 type transport system ATP-binding protein
MIELERVTKRYGALTALDNLTLSIGPGQIFGFIGPNGAGKTTTMKILSCLIRPDEGTAKVGGMDVRKDGDAIRRMLGYMPDFLGVYDDLTVDEYLQFFAAAFGVPRKKRRATIDAVLQLTDLTEKKRAMVDSLSRGMQQRLGVARVLIHDPQVLLLDEPASGLDPRARIEMRSLLQELGRMGKVLMVSSHILSELAEMCSSIGIIERGKLLYAGSIQDAYARSRGGEKILLRLEPCEGEVLRRAREELLKDSRVSRVTDDPADPLSLALEMMPPGEDPASRVPHHAVFESVARAGGRVASFEPQAIKLEDAFLRLTTGALQ